MGYKDQPFKGQRPQERPKTFSACGSSGAAEIGRLQCLCVLCSTVSARARALLQKGEAAAALHLCVQQGCITHPLPLSNNN